MRTLAIYSLQEYGPFSLSRTLIALICCVSLICIQNHFSSSAPKSHIHPFLDIKLNHQNIGYSTFDKFRFANNLDFLTRITFLCSLRINDQTLQSTAQRKADFTWWVRTRSCGFLTEAKACPGSTLTTSWSSAPRGAAGASASAAHACPVASSASGWS